MTPVEQIEQEIAELEQAAKEAKRTRMFNVAAKLSTRAAGMSRALQILNPTPLPETP